MRMPDFFLLGAPKCGTTALAQYLAEHPQVFMASPKEPHHFNSDHAHGDYKDSRAYAELFRGADDRHRAVGEASVWYLYSRVAVPRIEAELPGARYIVLLRDPAAMAPALHEQKVFSGSEPLLSFEEAWRAQADGVRLRRYARTEAETLRYAEACRLGSQLARLCERVERERILVLLLDDLRRDPRSEWCRVQAFLGLRDDGRGRFPVVNAAKERRSLLLKQAEDAYLHLRTRLAVPPLGTGLFARLDRWNRRARTRTPLSAAMQRELRAVFAPEVELLERLTGRDLSRWKDQGAPEWS